MTGGILGIVAGAGSLPAVACREALRAGWTVHLFPLVPLAAPEGLAGLHPISLGSPAKAMLSLKLNRVTDLLLVGKVVKAPLVRGEVPLDPEAERVLREAPTGRDDDLMRGVIGFLEKAGFRVRDQREFLGPHLASEGLLAGPSPGPGFAVPARLAFDLARGIGGLDIGQTVVVKEGVPVAVEALEGTDEAIRRAGLLAGPGCLVAKVAKPRQDFRFDVPTVGVGTIGAMAEARAAALVIEAGAVIIPDREEFAAAAEASGITVFGMSAGGW